MQQQLKSQLQHPPMPSPQLVIQQLQQQATRLGHQLATAERRLREARPPGSGKAACALCNCRAQGVALNEHAPPGVEEALRAQLRYLTDVVRAIDRRKQRESADPVETDDVDNALDSLAPRREKKARIITTLDDATALVEAALVAPGAAADPTAAALSDKIDLELLSDGGGGFASGGDGGALSVAELSAAVQRLLQQQSRVTGFVTGTATVHDRDGRICCPELPGIELRFNDRSVALDKKDPTRVPRLHDGCDFKLSDRGGTLKAMSVRLKTLRGGAVGTLAEAQQSLGTLGPQAQATGARAVAGLGPGPPVGQSAQFSDEATFNTYSTLPDSGSPFQTLSIDFVDRAAGATVGDSSMPDDMIASLQAQLVEPPPVAVQAGVPAAVVAQAGVPAPMAAMAGVLPSPHPPIVLPTGHPRLEGTPENAAPPPPRPGWDSSSDSGAEQAAA
jgi:hypothetical protein